MSDNTSHTGNRSRDQVPADPEQIVDAVRDRYGRIARGAERGCCGPPSSCCEPSPEEASLRVGYTRDEEGSVPEGANLGLGCGAPIAHLGLSEGETVLDLGSGGGFDAFLAAPRVGPRGHVIGVDMTPEMIERARENARRSGHSQVEFRQGRLEALPVEDTSVDAVTSNCVINLVPDKAAVFREVARVLRPGGRLVISDIVLDGELPEAIRSSLLAYVGCTAGAMQREDYFGALRRAGLTEVEVLVDADFLDAAGKTPDPVVEEMQRLGLSQADVAGVVRSVTYRATKPR